MFLWMNNWHLEGNLYERFGYGVVYDAASNVNA